MKVLLQQKYHKWIQALALVLVLGILSGGVAYADTKSDLADAKDDLADAIETVENLENKAEKTEDDLKEASATLDKLMAAQDQLEDDISSLQEDIDQNNIDLEEAQKTCDEEYASMKLRIQFMYENSSVDSLWEAVISSGSFSDMINRVEYISDVYQSDRDLMDKYENALAEVEAISEELASNMEDLLDLQEQYADEQEAVEKTVAMLQEKADEYATQIAAAEDTKDAYQDTVTELQAKVRAEEAAAAGASASSYDGGGTGSGGLGSADYLTDSSVNPEYKTSVSGDELVAYALQFVGCHYVWAGNTMGCTDWSDNVGVDCSGFVHQVYLHFGISTPRYSQAFKSVGQAVAYENIQAGDVVVYPGHVAIYIGNGCIVEAQGSKAGVTSSRSVTCHTITAIRRLL